MKERGYCYPYPAGRRSDTKIVESGPLGMATCVHDRPAYTMEEARLVCQWVNGFDRPLELMRDREYDPYDPGRAPSYKGHVGYITLQNRARRE